MIVRLRLGAFAAALALGALVGGCILGPKQDDPDRAMSPGPDEDTGGAIGSDGAVDAAAPGACGDDTSHANDGGTHYDACPPSQDSATMDAGADAPDGGDADAPEGGPSDAIDGGDDAEDGTVDGGTTGG